jgi:hypothetical protein
MDKSFDFQRIYWIADLTCFRAELNRRPPETLTISAVSRQCRDERLWPGSRKTNFGYLPLNTRRQVRCLRH